MKKAIIDPRETVSKTIGYDEKGNSVQQQIPNSARVAEVTDTEFTVGEPLFWMDCADDAVADQWYYDTVQDVCFIIPAPPVSNVQPIVVGANNI
ncbi:MAG: hypothetical protein ACR2IJ_07840 [Fluviibacter sp.]